MGRLSVVALFTVCANLGNSSTANPLRDLFPFLSRLAVHSQHPSVWLVALLSALSVLPVLLAVWTVASYLQAEPDEFIRALVIRAVLWGVAVTMAADAVMGVLMVSYGHPFPIGLLNADLLLASTGIAFRLLQRSYR